MHSSEFLKSSIGKLVVIEGSFPIPFEQGVVYSPSKGKLVAVLDDAIVVHQEQHPEDEPTVYMLASLRSVRPYNPSNIARVPSIVPPSRQH